MQEPLNLDLETTEASKERCDRDAVRDAARAALAQRLKEHEFQSVGGFPIGTEDAILSLSDPPNYTACPNPFLRTWVRDHAVPFQAGPDEYHVEPLAYDVSEGKSDAFYNAHSYHTKVPYKAIIRYILHYTRPGEIVCDGFCGSGMTGVAAQACSSKEAIHSLGYTVRDDGTITGPDGSQLSLLGARRAILNDLSPAATSIAYNLNTPLDLNRGTQIAREILADVERAYQCFYGVLHDASEAEIERIAAAVIGCSSRDDLAHLIKTLIDRSSGLLDPGSKLRIGALNNLVWSDVLRCPLCSVEFAFWDAAVDQLSGKVSDDFKCPHCNSELTKRTSERPLITKWDAALQSTVKQFVQVPVLIEYTVGRRSLQRKPNEFDLAMCRVAQQIGLENWVPTRELPIDRMYHGSRIEPKGVTHIHHFYSPRTLHILGALWSRISAIQDQRIKGFLCFWFDSHLINLSIQNRYRPEVSFPYNPLNGVYYISSMVCEANVFTAYQNKLRRLNDALSKAYSRHGAVIISTSDCARGMDIPAESVDYIFTDPPFGANIPYADLNYLVEGWYGVFSNMDDEAIIDSAKSKDLNQYKSMMAACFRRYYEALKPGRWMTVVFHNSHNSVWNGIHESINSAGFVIADVRILDKQQGSFRQVTASSVAKRDLVISCYKPSHEFEARFEHIKGTAGGVGEFVWQHLSMLPVAPVNGIGRLETVAERTRFMLYDRMVAYHLQRGAAIPLSAADFDRLLADQFIQRDGMYFLPEQAARFDALKARGVETEQLTIFVQDEKSAIQWIRAQLQREALSAGDLTPRFLQELRDWDAHEPRPELRDLLREYFIEGADRKWRIPDPTSERDLETIRRNALLRVFREYAAVRGTLKVFRKEAVLEGFRYCWDTKQYGVIVQVCEKIPARLLQDIQEFVQFYDIARDLTSERGEQLEFIWE